MEFALAALFTALGSVVAVLATLVLEHRRHNQEMAKEQLRLAQAERSSDRDKLVDACADFTALITAHGHLLQEKVRLLSGDRTDPVTVERLLQIEREMLEAHNAKLRPLFFVRLHSSKGLEAATNELSGWLYAFRDVVDRLEAGEEVSYVEDEWDASFVDLRVRLMKELAGMVGSLEVFDAPTVEQSKAMLRTRAAPATNETPAAAGPGHGSRQASRR